MKKSILFLALVLWAAFGYSQTVVYHENFESPSLADSVVSSGNPGWHVGSFLQHGGLRSDSSRVATNDSTYLTTTAYSTTGYSNVILQFSQICKIEFFDHATIEVSNNNGTTWTQLTTAQYLGTGFFTNNQFSASSYTDWLPGTPIVVPTNAWWKTEQFDISAFAGNAAQVKVRFKLKDGNGTGAGGNWGWVIDDIKVITAISELVPPVITLNAPVLQDTVYSTGPFLVSANITDASGIQYAKIAYKLNGAPLYDTITMLNTIGSTYEGYIPSFTYNKKIWYHVFATDNSVAHNLGTNPSSGDKWFYTKQGPTVVIVGTGTTNSYLLPANGWFNYNWSTQMYKSSEINMSGQIDSIAFYVGTATSSYVMNNQKVFIGHTNATTCGTTQPDTTTMTVAYSGSCTFTGPGWYKIKLQNTFYYNGSSNLLIYWTNRDGSYASGYPYFNYTATTDYLATENYNDTYSYVFPVSSGSQTYNRPNLRIAFVTTNYQQDAGISQINEPTGIVLASTPLPVKMTVKNFGADTLVKAKINWKLDGTLQTQYSWTGNLLQAVSSTPVTIATQSFSAGSHTIKAWTTLPNDSTDQNHFNDTTSASFYACTNILNGTYTIGGGGADFATFTAALLSLENCGINGPVIFNVNSGTYNEQLSIPEISGTSSINTITFQSATGVNTDVTLAYSSASSTSNYTVQLNGADHIRFKNMTIEASNSLYGHVVELANVATDNKFVGNKIIGLSTSSTSSDNALIFSGSASTSSDSLNVFDSNTFLNGSYGMYYSGASSTVLENKTTITNNTFTDQYYCGIYLYYQNAPIVRGNTIITSSTDTYYNGIYTGYCYNDMQILKNKISIVSGGYGIYLYDTYGILGKEGLIANNFVYLAAGASAYGIYTYYSNYLNIYYNSVNITSSNTTGGIAMYIGYSSVAINMKNNIFANTGLGYSLYSSVTSGITSDYNDLYTAGTNVGYWGSSNCATLANWQTLSTLDAHSLSINPSFTSPSNLHISALALNAAATPLTAVTDDIDGQTRNATTPDIGADEFTPAPIDLATSLLVTPPLTGCFTTNQTVTYRITNVGTSTLYCAQHNVIFNSSVSGVNPVTFPVVTLTTDTILSGASKNITVSTTYDMSVSGTYTFLGNVTVATDPNQINDTIAPVTITNYIINTFPYVVDFSGSPSPAWTIQQVFGSGNWTYLSGAMTGPVLAPVFGTGMLYFNSYSLGTGIRSRAITPTIDLTVVNNPQLEFWISQDNGYSSDLLEGVTVRISTDGGVTWNNDTLFAQRYNAAYSTAGWLKVTKSLNAYHTSSCVKIAFEAVSQVGNNVAIDKVQILEPPTQEAALPAITEPVSGCGLALEPVKIWIKNAGSMAINSNLTASYQLFGHAPVTEGVPGTIIPGDSTLFTFATLVNVAATTHDTTFSLKAYVTLLNDPIHTNDTAYTSIASGLIPSNPVASNTTIPYGTNTTLHATASDSVRWYAAPSGGLPLGTSAYFTTPTLFSTTTYYVEAVSNGNNQHWTFDTGLDGWTRQYPCSQSKNWVWASDGGHGCLYAYDTTTYSSKLIVSPSISVAGMNSFNLGFKHKYTTESCCDEGYVAYKLDNGTWNVFEPTVNTYNFTGRNVDNDPLNACTSDTKDAFGGTGTGYEVSSGSINTTGASTMQIAFVLTSDVSIGADGWYIDSVGVGNNGLSCTSPRVPVIVTVTGVPAYDAGVQIIYTPNTGIELTNQEAVKVKIKNYGTASISNFPVSYKIGNNIPVTETISSNINSNDTLLYTFTTKANLSAYSTYSFKAYTSLSGDVTHANDTAYKSVTNNMLTYCTSGALYTGYDNISNVTFAGINNTSTLPYNATYSDFTALPPAIVSRGVTYPISVSINYYSSYTYPGYCKVYIDYNHDGTFTEPGELAYSGAYTGIQTLTGNVTIPSNATPGYNRMRVVAVEYGTSSSVLPCGTYTYGETEDYIVMVLNPIPHDAGVISITQPAITENEGASVPVQVTVMNFGLDTIYNSTNMLVKYSLNGGAAVSTTWNQGTLLPQASGTITLPNITVPPGNNTICAYTVLAGDSNTINDQTCKAFYGNPLHDAGVTQIIQPGAISGAGTSSPVQVVVKNFGANTITSMSIAYKINNGTPVTQTWSGSLLTTATTNVTLANYTVPSATYNICAYTILASDGDHTNDTLCKNSFGIFKDTLPYYDDFEGTVNWYDTSLTTGTTWQLGTPAYGTTNTAHSPTNSWDVNLTTAYGANANAILYTQLFDFTNAQNAKLKFWINRNTEANYDGTRLEYTIDGGTTWNVLGVMNDPLGVNWYNIASIYSSSKPAWSGSYGWTKAEYTLSVLSGQPNVQFRFVFTSDASVQYDGFSIDDISITVPSPIDAGVEAITKPIAQTANGTTVQLKVRIRNFGNDTLHGIPLAYTINGGAPITANWPGYLAPNDTVSYWIPTTFTSPAGQYTICAYTTLTGDGDHLNDTTCKSIVGIPTFNIPYTDNFEGTNYWLSADGTAQWQYGTPTSSVINTAHSPVNCWKTNLDGDYVPSMNDNLYSPVFNLSPSMDTVTLSFWHWYNTESGADGGRVQYSLNGGTYITLGYVGDPLATNWCNSTIGGQVAWSGNSTGWVLSKYKLAKANFSNFNANIQFRFNFFSNTATQYNGWAIDDFSLTVSLIANDAGVISVDQPSGSTPMYSSVPVTVTIKNYGTNTLTSIPLAYKVNATTPVTGTYTGSLLPNGTASYSFTTPYTSPTTTYNLCAYTTLTGDTHTYNDTSCNSHTVTTALIDAGITKIVLPTGPITQIGVNTTVKATIKNFGVSTLTSIPVQFIVNGGTPVAETWTGTLAAGDSTDYTFTATYQPPALNFYTLCVKTALTTDLATTNDQKCKTFNNNVGIEEAANNGIYLGQNIPNPANDQTTIDYYVPVNGTAVFNVLNSIGQIVYTESSTVAMGDHKLKLDIGKLGAGIYYYTLTFNGSRLYRKMIISK